MSFVARHQIRWIFHWPRTHGYEIGEYEWRVATRKVPTSFSAAMYRLVQISFHKAYNMKVRLYRSLYLIIHAG